MVFVGKFHIIGTFLKAARECWDLRSFLGSAEATQGDFTDFTNQFSVIELINYSSSPFWILYIYYIILYYTSIFNVMLYTRWEARFFLWWFLIPQMANYWLNRVGLRDWFYHVSKNWFTFNSGIPPAGAQNEVSIHWWRVGAIPETFETTPCTAFGSKNGGFLMGYPIPMPTKTPGKGRLKHQILGTLFQTCSFFHCNHLNRLTMTFQGFRFSDFW